MVCGDRVCCFPIPPPSTQLGKTLSYMRNWTLQYTAPPLERLALAAEYMALVTAHPVPLRMVRGHVHKMVGDWLAEHTDLRHNINRLPPTVQLFRQMVDELRARVAASGRDYPIPQLSAAELVAADREEAKRAAIEEQEREADALDRLERSGCGMAGDSVEEDELVIDWSDGVVFACHEDGIVGGCSS
ncbi:hypothetical protein Vretimale_3793 [Volvox reticuliferus]|uniref:Uncharacterized protein n=1 Tax=Volvox reticuliferus TaxID=1737510 RepID=A0A8J4DFZ1_9CHLO|nr:hypothetical protein Vretimale_3793 [Volvox reticuliferus]